MNREQITARMAEVGVERTIIEFTVQAIRDVHRLGNFPYFRREDVGVLLHEIDRLEKENVELRSQINAESTANPQSQKKG